ncbi:MAG: ATP-binding protein [Usitatibacteraceae bacterium]
MPLATSPSGRPISRECVLMEVPAIMREGCQIISFDWTARRIGECPSRQDDFADADAAGQSVLSAYPGFENTELYASLRRAMDERISLGLQECFDCADGSVAWFQIRIRPVLEGVLVLSVDITSQKSAEEELQQRSEQLNAQLAENASALAGTKKELEALCTSVSHDLRAPLRHMDGFARLAAEQTEGIGENTKEYLAKIVKASAKMGALIDDLLALSRIGRAELNIRPVDLQSLVAGVGAEFLAKSGEQKVEWVLGELPQVLGDRTLLRQAFANIIGNAFKFTRNRSHAVIKVSARAVENNEIEISVQDNGVGFDMRFVDKLYGVFQRLHHERDFEGTGMGLAATRKILDRMGGKTWAEGEPGDGATFYLRVKGV